jgi:hypothetical protein
MRLQPVGIVRLQAKARDLSPRPSPPQIDSFVPATVRRAAMPRFVPISQLKPEGEATPAGYSGGTNCGPTCVATILRGFGIAGLPTGNTDLVNALAVQLGTNSHGTGAANLPAVLAAYGLKTEQQARNTGSFSRGAFYGLTPAQRLAELSKVVEPKEATRLMGEVKAQRITLDSVRLLGAQAQTEGFIKAHVEQGHPVMINVGFAALHPGQGRTGHYVTVTAVQCGADGRVSSYAIVDPWTGKTAQISAEQMGLAIAGNSNCLPTAVFR